MTANAARIAARHIGRPVLMVPDQALHWLGRIQSVDPNFSARPNRLQAFFRRLAGSTAARPAAMDDDEVRPQVPFNVRAAYTPLYIGEPDDYGFCWSLKSGIALINCDTPLLARGEDFCGTIFHGYDTLLAALRSAREDDRVKAIFFRMDSPGGVVDGGLSQLAAWMRANRAAAGGKPIWIYADMAASAAYWISAQADRIVAPRVGVVGSIGAVVLHEDYSAALEKAGVAITAITFGEKKVDGNWWEKLSPAAKADIQSEINECGRLFTADVVAGRPGLSIEKQIATQAACFLAQHEDEARSGLAIGLVDDISGEEDAFLALLNSVSGAAPVPNPTTPALAANADKPKEQGMDTPEKKAARVAALKIDLAAARAATPKDATKVASLVGQLKAEGEDEKDEGEEPENPSPAPEKKPEDEKPEDEAVKIAKSPEAKTHAHLVGPAIAEGMTLGQFKAMCAAGAGKGKLAQHLDNSPRLGADAEGGSSPGDQLQARAQARADAFKNGGRK